MNEPTAQGTAGAAAESLSGFIERVTFHSEDTGFTVMKVKARGHRSEIAVVGTAADANAGEWIEAAGEWVIDPQHGRQFKASAITFSRPDTLEGIEKYLGSGLIRGIGPHYARRLVEKFGKDVFDVIEHRSAELLRVEGIGRTRRECIREAWAEQKSIREIMTFLFSHGVSTARAYRIFKQYGEKAIEKVRLDPYCLSRDIHGIGFKTADLIAGRLGISAESDLRARAGVEHVLQELTADGHCAYPRAELEELTAKSLEIPSETVTRAVDHGLGEGRLVAVRGPDGGPLIYPSALDLAERELARLLRKLAAGRHPLHGIDADRAASWVEERIRITLDPVQREALVAALRSKVLVLTGGPGVGKTTLVNAILRIYRAKDLRVVLCAPTGRAAKRLTETTGAPAKTIHRLLHFDPRSGGFQHHASEPLDAQVVVVDETSMLDVTLAWQLVRAVPAGAALLLVGDADQLPSVGPGSVLRDLIDSGALPVCRLKHVFRQAAQSRIITNAHRINEGEMPEFPPPAAAGGEAVDFYFADADDPAQAIQQILRLVRERIPARFGLDPIEDVQILTPMQRGELGARNLNVVLQQALNPDGPFVERFGTRYRVGDKVMQIENDYDKDVYNGDIGRVTAIREDDRTLDVRFDEKKVTYGFQEMDELVLSYATTIHKSQGSEYPCVVVPVHTQHYIMLQRNLLYTAVTRGRKLVVLVGTKKAVAIAVQRNESVRRITMLAARLRDADPHAADPGAIPGLGGGRRPARGRSEEPRDPGH